jgi:hypothetical protein
MKYWQKIIVFKNEKLYVTSTIKIKSTLGLKNPGDFCICSKDKSLVLEDYFWENSKPSTEIKVSFEMKLRKMNAKTSATSFSEISSKEENNDSLNMSKSSII